MLKKFIVYFIGNLGSKILSFLMVPLYTSLLLPSEFGFYDYWGTIIGLVSTIIGMELFRASYTNILKYKGSIYKQQEVVVISLQFLVLQLIIIALLGGGLFVLIPQYAIFIAVIIAFTLIIEFFAAITRGIENNKLIASAGVIQTFVTLSVTIILLYAKLGNTDNISLLFIGQVIGMITVTCYYLAVFRKQEIFAGIQWKIFNWNKYSKLLLFSLPLVPSAISWWVMNVSDRFLIIHYLGESSNGLYAMAYKFPSLLMMINTIVALVWQDEAILTNESEQRGSYYSKQLKKYMIVQFIALIIFTIGFKYIAPIMLRNDFTEAINYVPLLGLSVVFSGLSSFYGTFYLSTGRTRGAFATSIYGALTNICINIIFINILGLYAAAISTVASFVVMAVIRIFEFRKELEIKFPIIETLSGIVFFFIIYFFLYM